MAQEAPKSVRPGRSSQLTEQSAKTTGTKTTRTTKTTGARTTRAGTTGAKTGAKTTRATGSQPTETRTTAAPPPSTPERTPGTKLLEASTTGTSTTLVPVPVDREPQADPRRSDVDEWGRSEHLRNILRTLVDPIYRHWFRAEWENFDRIPSEGGALLVSNHAGAIPSDAGTIMHGVETELGRPVYTLADEFFKKLPLINIYWQRLGGVQAHPDNAYRLLREQGQLVLTFPEGNKGPGKHFSERYQLRRFGRGGFVEIALRAGVPIIPIAVVGAEESMPILYKSPTLAKLTGLPYFPVTANMLLLGPLGIVTYLPAKFRLRVLEPITFDEPPDQPRYSRSHIMDTAERIRQRIQEALYDMLRKRESVWRG